MYMSTVEQQLEYAIKHEPVRYFVKRYGFFWKVENIQGLCCGVFFLKSSAIAECNVLNSVFALGYTKGQESILTIWQNTEKRQG